MKKIYLKTLLVFVSLFSTLLAFADTEPALEKDQLERIKTQIAFSEYFIRWQDAPAAYQSPNRRNGLQASYTGGGMTITAQESHPDWSFGLSVTNITGDGRQLYKPVQQPLVYLHENKIRFNHDDQFTVEYVNTEEGIRQNFIIERPVYAPEKISVRMQVAAGWKTEQESATSLLFRHGKEELIYNGLKVWDAKGRTLPAHFVVTNDLVQIEVEAAGAVYPVTVDPLVANSTPQTANLFLQSNKNEALMGWSVAGAGDINNDGYDDVVIGVPRWTNGQNEEGAVFVYYGSQLGINPTTFTFMESNQDSAWFGYTVAAAGHVNFDSYGDVVVGSPHVRIAPLQGFVGKFSVFNGSGTGLSTTADAVIEGSASNAFLGEILSSAGDVNGDTYDDIIAGEWGTLNQYGALGVVWIYYGGPWGVAFTVPTMLQGFVPISAGTFGRSAASAGDVNGDGLADVLLGSPGGPFSSYHGSVNVYYGNYAGLDTIPNVVLTGQSSYFGYKVAAAGDINGDQYGDVIVSAYGDTVFVYHGSATGLVNTPNSRVASPQGIGGAYGVSIAGAGDLNNDGFDDIIIGSPEANIGQSFEGAAYVHYGRAIGINPVPGATIQSNQVNGELGWCVAGAGDVNNDGFNDVIVGAPTYTLGQTREGAAFIYHGIAVSAGRTMNPLPANAAPEQPVANVKVFPNPVVNDLSLQLDGLDEHHITYVQILNAQGVCVKTANLEKMKSGRQFIGLGDLTTGLYLVVIKNGKNTFKEKIIKQ